ncbi:hypothetical protein Tco_1073495 [Tanacetum coccineum]
MLPRPQIYLQPHIISIGIRLVFDPTKSPHFKVVHVGLKTDYDFDDCDGYHDVGYHDNGDGSYLQIETYSSKIGSWSVCVNRFDLKRFNGFELGIYSNGVLHWLNFEDGRYWHVKLDILVDLPVLTIIQLPVKLDGELFRDLKNGYSEWSLKCLVNLDDTMMPLPKEWRIHSRFWCIALGEREEDSFMVIKSIAKVLQYKILLKTVRTLFDFRSIDTHESFLFVASFAGV